MPDPKVPQQTISGRFSSSDVPFKPWPFTVHKQRTVAEGTLKPSPFLWADYADLEQRVLANSFNMEVQGKPLNSPKQEDE